MSYYYRPAKRKFKVKGEEKVKYSAIAKSIRLINTTELASEISARSAVKESSVLAVLMELSDCMAEKLCTGYKLKMDGIGSFGISITSPTVDNPDEINPKKIKFSKITYRPEPKLVKKLREIKYTKEPPPPKGYIPRTKRKRIEE